MINSELLKKQLEDENLYFLQTHTGYSYDEAKKIFDSIFEEVQVDSKNEGTDSLPDLFGNKILEMESSDPDVKNVLDKKRKEGVSDNDIRWWWNMNDIERRLKIKLLEIQKNTFISKICSQYGLNTEEAEKIFRKSHPVFGAPEDNMEIPDEDQPLPYELMDKIFVFIDRIYQLNDKDIIEEVSKSSTFNAFLRHQIKAGKI